MPQRRAGRGTGRALRGAAEPRGEHGRGHGESEGERRERGGRAAHTAESSGAETQHRRWDCGNASWESR